MRTGQVWSEEPKNEQNDASQQDTPPALDNAEVVVPATRQDARHGELRALAVLLTLVHSTPRETAPPIPGDKAVPMAAEPLTVPVIQEEERAEARLSATAAAMLGLVGIGLATSLGIKPREKRDEEALA